MGTRPTSRSQRKGDQGRSRDEDRRDGSEREVTLGVVLEEDLFHGRRMVAKEEWRSSTVAGIGRYLTRNELFHEVPERRREGK